MPAQLYLISPPKIDLPEFRKTLAEALHINSSPTGRGKLSQLAGDSSPASTKKAGEGDLSSVRPHPSPLPMGEGAIPSPDGRGSSFVSAFQLRLKDADDAQIKAAVRELMPLCRDHDCAFILNDRPDIATELGCDGVHLGQEDIITFRSPLGGEQSRPSANHAGQDVGGKYTASLPPTLRTSSDDSSFATPPQGGSENIRRIRSQLPEEMALGITCHASRHLAMEAGECGADYVAFGAFYPTTSKPKEKLEKWGTPTADILSWWGELSTIPSVAIGGITPENAAPLAAAGADFIAVITAVWNHPEGPAAGVAAFKNALGAP